MNLKDFAVTIRFTASSDMIHESVAYLIANGRKPSLRSVKEVIRSVYESEGNMADVDAQESISTHFTEHPDDDDYHKASIILVSWGVW